MDHRCSGRSCRDVPIDCDCFRRCHGASYQGYHGCDDQAGFARLVVDIAGVLRGSRPGIEGCGAGCSSIPERDFSRDGDCACGPRNDQFGARHRRCPAIGNSGDEGASGSEVGSNDVGERVHDSGSDIRENQRDVSVVDGGVSGAQAPDFVPSSGHGTRGKNWERNRKNREAQKERKRLRKQTGFDWRRSASSDRASVRATGPGVESWIGGSASSGKGLDEAKPGEKPQEDVCVRGRALADKVALGGSEGFKEGFFVECSSDVRRKLRESRAAVLIAENERREFEEKKKLERLKKQQDPVVELVGEMIRVTRMTEQLKKQTKDSKISGWAETIADSLSKSTASSGPSSVPSVESVQKESALRSEGECVEFDQEREVRLMNYNLRKVQLDRHFDALDGYGIEEHDRAYSMLKDEFSDVAKTEAERQSEVAVKRIADSLQQAGFDQYAIQDIIEKAGYAYDA